jgi:sigma-E factor negative regulatory protein RseC
MASERNAESGDPVHHGVVQALDGDHASVAVTVRGCSGCGEKSGCAIGKLSGEGKTAHLRLPVEPGLRAGDRVRLSLGHGGLNRAALIGYLLPALLLVVGAAIGEALSASNGGAALGALLGGGVALLLGRALPRIFPGADCALHVSREP